MYTSHGHQIPGTPVLQPAPENRARCGGPGLCRECSVQAWQVAFEKEKPKTFALPEISEPTITQIPPAPLTDEELRLESIALAVEWTASLSAMSVESLVDISEHIKKYIRPTE